MTTFIDNFKTFSIMDVDDIKQFIPLKVKAEVAFQNQDYIEAANLAVEFAYHLTQYYSTGDKSYDSLRAAYLGTSTAALLLGQMDNDDAEHYSKEALKYAGELYDADNSPNNAIQIVVSTKVLLFNIDLYAYCTDSTYYDDAISLAKTLIGFLNKYFPNEETVNNIVDSFKSAYDLLQRRLENVREYYVQLGSDSRTDHRIAENLLADTTEFRYIYDKCWKKNINLDADDYILALHYPILDDESIDYARECSVSEMCMNKDAENWEGLSDRFFDSYEEICEVYGIASVNYCRIPDAALIPVISNHNLSTFKKYVINCFLSLFAKKVPVITDFSLADIFDTDKVCALAERACDDGLAEIGRFLLNFAECIIEIDGIAIDNAMLYAKARKLMVGQQLLQSKEQISKDLEDRIRQDSAEIAAEIRERLSRYIDAVYAKGFSNRLTADAYTSEFIRALLEKQNFYHRKLSKG